MQPHRPAEGGIAARLKAGIDTRGQRPRSTATQREPVAGSTSPAVAVLFGTQPAADTTTTGADAASRSDASTARSGGPLGTRGATFPPPTAGRGRGGGVAPRVPLGDLFPPLETPRGTSSTPGRFALLTKIQRLCRSGLADDERGPAVCGCGSPALDTPTVDYHLRPGEAGPRAGLSKVKRCKSPWLCPTCAPAAAKLRAERVQVATDAAFARGGAVALVVLTASHALATPLADLKALVGNASRRARSGRAWVRLSEATNLAGVVVGQETTLSRVAGWHYHQHLAVVVDGDDRPNARPARERALEAARGVVEAYKARIRAAGGTVSDEHGVFVRIAETAEDAAGYTSKGSMAWEVSGGHKDRTKTGTSLTPWDLARAAYDGDAWARARWAEYAQVMPGTRSCVVSAALAKRLGVEAPDDEQPGDEAFEEHDGRVGSLPSLVHRTLMREGLVSTFLARLETTAAEIVTDDSAEAIEAAGRAVFPALAAWATEAAREADERHEARREARRRAKEDTDARRQAAADAETRRHLVQRVAARVETRGGAGTRTAIVRAIADVAAAVPGVAAPTVAEVVAELARRQVDRLPIAA